MLKYVTGVCKSVFFFLLSLRSHYLCTLLTTARSCISTKARCLSPVVRFVFLSTGRHSQYHGRFSVFTSSFLLLLPIFSSIWRSNWDSSSSVDCSERRHYYHSLFFRLVNIHCINLACSGDVNDLPFSAVPPGADSAPAGGAVRPSDPGGGCAQESGNRIRVAKMGPRESLCDILRLQMLFPIVSIESRTAGKPSTLGFLSFLCLDYSSHCFGKFETPRAGRPVLDPTGNEKRDVDESTSGSLATRGTHQQATFCPRSLAFRPASLLLLRILKVCLHTYSNRT
eukprot:284815428_4